MTKAYVMHRGWLGEYGVEVTVEEYTEGRCIVKAVRGYPFDMWRESRDIPCGAQKLSRHDTYWYDSKIVSLSAVRVETEAEARKRQIANDLDWRDEMDTRESVRPL